MALAIDGYSVLRSIGNHPDAFADIAADVAKDAQKLVVKQMKADANVNSLRRVYTALGSEAFSLVVDGMSDAEIKTRLGKLDKNHPELKGSTALWRRHQFNALASGAAEPAEKIEKPKQQKSSKPRAKATGPDLLEPPRLNSEAMAAVRRRR